MILDINIGLVHVERFEGNLTLFECTVYDKLPPFLALHKMLHCMHVRTHTHNMIGYIWLDTDFPSKTSIPCCVLPPPVTGRLIHVTGVMFVIATRLNILAEHTILWYNKPIGLGQKSSGILIAQEENIRKPGHGMKLQRVLLESPSV